ncbi:hypothetical protein Vadar_001564 [Vaccinium darrowii]|uniref:Uncharacterized protein n=1 Tax=Vaccinium darrowii TaxID=229202 RepID=A0ACB7YII2_9ERIC|nr:hypothetical protein Vadar_001564 [Vaccinium darrowii]
MYKNQLQELAQRSCFNLPSYTCIREGPDHAPRFKSVVNFNGDSFESPSFCTTLRQAEHSAAEVALNALAMSGPSHSLAARILDETGVYKNLLQEVSQRVAASLPIYTTFRSGIGHLPFNCTVELAGIRFTGEPAKNKKQAEKNAAMTAWSSLKLLAQQSECSSSKKANNDAQEHVAVSRALLNFLRKAKMLNVSFPIQFPTQNPSPLTTTKPPPIRASKILPLIYSKAARNKPIITPVNNRPLNPTMNETIFPRAPSESQPVVSASNDGPLLLPESPRIQPLKFPAAGAAPYIPVRNFRAYHGIAPPVTIRNAIPVFSAPPLPPPSQSPQLRRPPPASIAPPVCIRPTLPVFAAPPVRIEESPVSTTPPTRQAGNSVHIESGVQINQKESVVVTQELQELKI